MQNKKLSLLVLSCDKYSDLWDNFFKLRDKFWPDCPFEWYLITESKAYSYPNVNIIHTGQNLNWTGRIRYALEKVKSPYIGCYLDDFYISKNVDNSIIVELIKRMELEHIDYINVSDVFDSLIKMPEPHVYYDKYLLKIPCHKKYGISTASAIWDRKYLIDIIGDSDINAWQFEINLCQQALTEEGLPGIILCDERKPFNVTSVPVVIQGRYYPKSIKDFSKKGIDIDYGYRGLMRKKEVLIYDINSSIRSILRSHPQLSKEIKWIAKKILRVKFFT